MPKNPQKRDQTPQSPPPAPPKRNFSLAVVVTLAVAGAAIALIAYTRSSGAVIPGGAGEQADQSVAAVAPVTESTAPPASARFGPHKQPTLPPLPFGPGPPARPPDVVHSVYRFAAEYPEVLGYAPCYCGCERSGHRGNDDCFVSARAANGDVTSWEPHGMT